MDSSRAVKELKDLREQAVNNSVVGGGADFTSWKARGKTVLLTALGKESHLVESWDDISYSLSIWTTSTPRSAWVDARRRGLEKAIGIIDAAIYEIELSADLVSAPVEVDSELFDPELWAYVSALADAGDWGKVPSQVVIFVEDTLRVWAGYPVDTRGEQLFGANLFASVLGDSSELRLGSRSSEHEGWRSIATGLAKAVGNVDRHRIQQRSDAKKYAIGVLGMASLLLTQLRHEHGDLIAERRSSSNEE
ncbi:TIGR02391 family protein [Pseudonocardia alni]|jgi:hypothetical protein|uniref:TIGR02391 family protein n=1 Tax=Pseudonocardia alni TaxID=33907 RepID=UPI0033E9E90B